MTTPSQSMACIPAEGAGYGPLPVVIGVIAYAVWESWRHREKPAKIIHNENHGVVEDAILAALDEYRQRRTQEGATNGR